MHNEPTALERFIRGILPENPLYRQLLGLCPALAVTSGVESAITMAGATGFVLICANTLVSLIRHLLKPHLRILVYTLTIATFVTIADRFLAAYMWDMSKQLGPYIPLIIVNCVIVGRCEICGSKQNPFIAASDALGQSIGFGLGLVSIAAVREILATGGMAGFQMLPQAWPNWVAMGLPPGAFLTLGLLLGLVNWLATRHGQKAVTKKEAK